MRILFFLDFIVAAFLLTLLPSSDGTAIFCPLLDLASTVYGREDTPLDLYAAWLQAGSLGQLFHTGCAPTLPSDQEFTCQPSAVCSQMKQAIYMDFSNET